MDLFVCHVLRVSHWHQFSGSAWIPPETAHLVTHVCVSRVCRLSTTCSVCPTCASLASISRLSVDIQTQQIWSHLCAPCLQVEYNLFGMSFVRLTGVKFRGELPDHDGMHHATWHSQDDVTQGNDAGTNLGELSGAKGYLYTGREGGSFVCRDCFWSDQRSIPSGKEMLQTTQTGPIG